MNHSYIFGQYRFCTSNAWMFFGYIYHTFCIPASKTSLPHQQWKIMRPSLGYHRPYEFLLQNRWTLHPTECIKFYISIQVPLLVESYIPGVIAIASWRFQITSNWIHRHRWTRWMPNDVAVMHEAHGNKQTYKINE